MIDGSCSLLLMLDNTLYAARDKYGRTPVVIGKRNGAYAAAMESTSLPNLDFDTECELGPGEIVKLTANEKVQLKAPGDCMQICSFFWVYFGYPSSNFEGTNTETVRYQNGELLAEGDDIDVDSVCGIPDSGVAHAIGFSNAAHKPYQRSFVKYTPTWARSFMPQNQKMRSLVARMKLIPIVEQIAGKKLLFCDDSIVRGTQLKDTVGRLYRRGALEVHMRSASPPLVYGCKFLNFSTSRSELDLAARRSIARIEGHDPDDATVAEYTVFGSEKYNMMVEGVRKELNLTSLRFQKLERLIEAIGLPREQICTYCWTGTEPETKD
jgi:amidophosphoribosyltransferase